MISRMDTVIVHKGMVDVVMGNDLDLGNYACIRQVYLTTFFYFHLHTSWVDFAFLDSIPLQDYFLGLEAFVL